MSVSGAQKKLRENPGIYEAILAREDGACLSEYLSHNCLALSEYSP